MSEKEAGAINQGVNYAKTGANFAGQAVDSSVQGLLDATRRFRAGAGNWAKGGTAQMADPKATREHLKAFAKKEMERKSKAQARGVGRIQKQVGIDRAAQADKIKDQRKARDTAQQQELRKSLEGDIVNIRQGFPKGTGRADRQATARTSIASILKKRGMSDADAMRNADAIVGKEFGLVGDVKHYVKNNPGKVSGRATLYGGVVPATSYQTAKAIDEFKGDEDSVMDAGAKKLSKAFRGQDATDVDAMMSSALADPKMRQGTPKDPVEDSSIIPEGMGGTAAAAGGGALAGGGLAYLYNKLTADEEEDAKDPEKAKRKKAVITALGSLLGAGAGVGIKHLAGRENTASEIQHPKLLVLLKEARHRGVL